MVGGDTLVRHTALAGQHPNDDIGYSDLGLGGCKHRQTDRRRDRQSDRETDRRRDRQSADRQTDRRETYSELGTQAQHTHAHTYIVAVATET